MSQGITNGQPQPGGKPKEQWGTRLGVILAVAGSAVGLGNFLRFPGQAAAHGGGAFMIPYFLALVFVAIPICWAEWAMGRFGGRKGYNSAPAIFGVLGGKSRYRYMGVLGVMVPLMIYMYYVLIEAWCLGYAWSYLTGSIDLGNDPSAYGQKSSEFFAMLTGASEHGAVFGGASQLLLFAVIAFVLNFILIYRGVSKGIEAFCIRAMPVMAICAVIVLVRVLTLGTPNDDFPERNVINGLGSMWNPVGEEGKSWFSALTNAETWLAAVGQIFFSMSVGFGIIVNYASYVRRNDDVVLSGLTAASTNEFFEVCLGGLITIPAAFIFLGAAGTMGEGFALGFETLPVVFKYMFGGNFFGFVWFFMLFLAAITSSVSMLQPVIAFLEEGLGIGRRASVTLLGVITATGAGFILYFSRGLTALDTVDFWVGTAFIYVLATMEVILFAWVFGIDRGYDEAMRGAELKIPKAWKFILKYVSPTFLIVVFVFWCKDNLPDRLRAMNPRRVATEAGDVASSALETADAPPDYTVLMSILLIVAVAVFITILVRIASKRWGNDGLESAGLADREATS